MLQRLHNSLLSKISAIASVALLIFHFHSAPAYARTPSLRELMKIEGFSGMVVAVAGLQNSMGDYLQNPMDGWRRQNVQAAVQAMPGAMIGLAKEFKKGKLQDDDLQTVQSLLGDYLTTGITEKLKKFAAAKNPTPDMLPSLGKDFPKDLLQPKAQTPAGGPKRLTSVEGSQNIADTGTATGVKLPKNQLVELNQFSNGVDSVDIQARRIANESSKDSLTKQLENDLKEVEKKADSRSRVANPSSYKTTVKPKYWRFHSLVMRVNAAMIEKARAEEDEEGGGAGDVAAELLMAAAMVMMALVPLFVQQIKSASEERQQKMQLADKQLTLDKTIEAQEKAAAITDQANKEQLASLERQSERQIAADNERFMLAYNQSKEVTEITKQQWQQNFDAKAKFERDQFAAMEAETNANLASVQNLVNQKSAELDLITNGSSTGTQTAVPGRLNVDRIVSSRVPGGGTSSTGGTASGVQRTRLPGGTAFTDKKVSGSPAIVSASMAAANAAIAGRGIRGVSPATSNRLLASAESESGEPDAEKAKKNLKGKNAKRIVKPVKLASLGSSRGFSSGSSISLNSAEIDRISDALRENSHLGGSMRDRRVKAEPKAEKIATALSGFAARNNEATFAGQLSAERAIRVVNDDGGSGEKSLGGHGSGEGSGRGIRSSSVGVGGYNEPSSIASDAIPAGILPFMPGAN